MSEDDRGVPPGWSTYMVSDEDGSSWEAEHLRREPMYATRSEAWAEVDATDRATARDGALALILAQAEIIADAIEASTLTDQWAEIVADHLGLAEVFMGDREPSSPSEEATIRGWCEKMDEIGDRKR